MSKRLKFQIINITTILEALYKTYSSEPQFLEVDSLVEAVVILRACLDK